MKRVVEALLEDYLLQTEAVNQIADKPKWKTFFVLSILDVVISVAIVSPSVVAIWRCIWELTTVIASERMGDLEIYYCICTLFGFIITFLIDTFHKT